MQLFILGVTTVQLAWPELDLGTLQTLWWVMPEFRSLSSQFKAEICWWNICWWNIAITYVLQGHCKTSINFLEASVTIAFAPPEWKVGCSINGADAPVCLADPPETLPAELDSDCLETDSRERAMPKTGWVLARRSNVALVPGLHKRGGKNSWKIPCFVPSRLSWGMWQWMGGLTMNGENICLGFRRLPAVCFAHLPNFLCGSLLAIVLAFTPVSINLMELEAIFITLPPGTQAACLPGVNGSQAQLYACRG